ncbi:MAG: hypothetical protein ACO3M1_06610 [Ilumatobacteraceae bacterium]
MKQKDSNAPYQLHGVNISYFTGKLEAYMRYKDIPHELVDGYDLGNNTSGLEEHAAIANTKNKAYARRRNTPKS